ncbi:MAG: hypothetical protein MUF49_15210 [Oculatellaceae cyanobacterium Prado106]|jgi:hypothetical protein|nr:hypothetical protein [Oculatellaceae cyanobacterium Prado106]
MVRQDSSHSIAIFVSAILFLAIAIVTTYQRFSTPIPRPDATATYGIQQD